MPILHAAHQVGKGQRTEKNALTCSHTIHFPGISHHFEIDHLPVNLPVPTLDMICLHDLACQSFPNIPDQAGDGCGTFTLRDPV